VAFAEYRDMKEAEREQADVRTMRDLAHFYKHRLVRVRNVTWRVAYFGAYIQSLFILLLPTFDNLYIITLLSSFVILKSILGFRNFHLEDLGSDMLQTLKN